MNKVITIHDTDKLKRAQNEQVLILAINEQNSSSSRSIGMKQRLNVPGAKEYDSEDPI